MDLLAIDEVCRRANGRRIQTRTSFHRWNEKIADDPAWEKAIVDPCPAYEYKAKTVKLATVSLWEMKVRWMYLERALAWTKKFDQSKDHPGPAMCKIP